LALIIAALGNPRIAKIKHQSQTGEVLPDVGQNESKIKEIILNASSFTILPENRFST
jgi:hypothetical protein